MMNVSSRKQTARGQKTDNGEDMYTSHSEENARSIMSEHFISLDEVEKAHNFCYTEAQRIALIEATPCFETLWNLWDEGCGLMATLPTAHNLLQLKALDNPLFSRKSERWLTRSSQKFSHEDVVPECQWLAFHIKPRPDAFDMFWADQENLLTQEEYIPNVAEVAYFITTYNKARRTCLLKNVSVRTASVDASGQNVIIGDTNADGPIVRRFWNDNRKDCIGVASARRLSSLP
jgi:hypothetical protein